MRYPPCIAPLLHMLRSIPPRKFVVAVALYAVVYVVDMAPLYFYTSLWSASRVCVANTFDYHPREETHDFESTAYAIDINTKVLLFKAKCSHSQPKQQTREDLSFLFVQRRAGVWFPLSDMRTIDHLYPNPPGIRYEVLEPYNSKTHQRFFLGTITNADIHHIRSIYSNGVTLNVEIKFNMFALYINQDNELCSLSAYDDTGTLLTTLEVAKTSASCNR